MEFHVCRYCNIQYQCFLLKRPCLPPFYHVHCIRKVIGLRVRITKSKFHLNNSKLVFSGISDIQGELLPQRNRQLKPIIKGGDKVG